MIEFCGEISDECKRYILKRETKAVFLSMLIVSMVFAIIVIIVALSWNILVMQFLLLPAIIIILAAIPQKKTIASKLPTKLIIDDEIIEVECLKLPQYRSIIDVKKVVDAGGWYHIIFYLGHKSLYFVCQKNLITKGSIEEFEKLFEGKIEKK